MAKVDGSISSLIQGVSQQPERERLPGQGSLQENFSSDPVNGLTRRGPTKYIDELINSADDYTFVDYDAGSIGHFMIAHKSGDIKVFDLDGTEYTVTINSGSGYIPDTELLYIGIDDKIYVVDPDQVVAMDSSTKSYVEDGSLVFLLGGQYGRKYEITLTWKDAAETEYTETVSYTTPNGSSASHINNIATDSIATSLETALNANTNITDDFDVFRESDVIYIKKEDAADVTTYKVTVSDGDGGANMFSVNNEVNDVGNLPRFAPQGYITKIVESGGSTADDWYLEFVVSPDANGDSPALGDGFGEDGAWVEAVAPDVEYIIDAATMPHILEKTGPTDFEFSEGTWENRNVGDDDTNPLPSFIGQKINDIGTFQGRLTMLADVNIIMSRTNKHLDFWNQSATTQVDDDPIDISSALGTFVLRKMVPHNRDLIIFSDKVQFVLFGRNALTPKNSSLVLTTEFEADLRADPVAAGRNVFFPFKYGTYTGIQEFFTDGGEDVNDSRPITQHVLQYIPGTPTQLVSTTNFNKLIVRTDDDVRKIRIYEYVWLNREKVQSSWSTWSFSRDILHMFFVDNLLYILTKEGNSYEAYTLDLDDTPDTGPGYRVMLDEQLEKTVASTTFTVPYTIDDIDNYVAVQGTGCPYPGLRAPIASYSAGTVTLQDDMGGGTVHFGRKFLSRYIPTSPFVRDRDGVKVGSGKLIIKQYVVHFADTGYFKSIITDDYGYSAEVLYTGRVLGDPENVVGEPSVSDGSFLTPYKKNADNSTLEIQSDSHLPASFLEMEWVGQYKKKGKRITGG